MSNIDEEIIRMTKKEESKDKLKLQKIESFERKLMDGVASREVIIKGRSIKFKEIFVIDGKVSVLMPETFDLMEEEYVQMKYPANKGFDAVYSDDSTTINCTFLCNQTPVDDNELKELKDELVKIFREMHPKAEFYEEGVEVFTNKKVGFYDLLFDAPDGKIYNLIIVMELEGRLFMSNFNCTIDNVKYWKPILKGMMKSIKVVENV